MHLRLFALLCLLCVPAGAHAAGVNVVQALDFGRWHVTNNTGAYSVSVAVDGTYSYAPQLVMLYPPRHGIYTITGLPAATIVSSVIVTQLQPLRSGAGREFTMDNFAISHPPSTDGGGNLPLTVGAEASTSGDGSAYGTATHSGQLSVEINY